MKQQIAKLVEDTLKQLGINDISPQVDYPADAAHGDYTTNVAMIVAKKAGRQDPRGLASELKEKLEKSEIFEKIEVAGPGFINFFVKDTLFIKNVFSKKYNSSAKFLAGKKIMVEFTDPNPFKEFHIGHLYSNIVGESLSRLLEANGAEVWRVDYFGDVGMHVAKSLWGLESKLQETNAPYHSMQELAEIPLQERIRFLGEAYAHGATAYEEDSDATEVIRLINRHVYIAAQKMWEQEKGIKPTVDYKQSKTIDEETLDHILEMYKLGRAWSLEYFETIYARLGTKFRAYYPESIAGERGYTLVKDAQRHGIFVESEGAIVYPEHKSGLHTRVFINQLGLPTYEAKELGLAPWKYEDFPYDQSIIVTGNEINEYFKILLTALKEINPQLGEKTKHLSHGMVKLPEGKMSSRTGKIVTGEWLLNEAKDRALKLSNDEAIAEIVGVGAIKYALLKTGIGKDVEFSFEDSISFEGNSGPYLQYTYARTQSVLRKSEIRNPTLPAGWQEFETPKELASEERELLRLLVRFDEIVEESALRYSPNIVATYLFDLAQTFNLFYQKHQILKAETPVKGFRLALTSTTGNTLKQGLYLLGIQSPPSM